MTSTLSLITFIFWVIAGLMTFIVCIINAYKTRGGRFSAAFISLGFGTLFLATSAIIATFFNTYFGRDITQLLHDGGFVIGFILVLSASNRFLGALRGNG